MTRAEVVVRSGLFQSRLPPPNDPRGDSALVMNHNKVYHGESIATLQWTAHYSTLAALVVLESLQNARCLELQRTTVILVTTYQHVPGMYLK